MQAELQNRELSFYRTQHIALQSLHSWYSSDYCRRWWSCAFTRYVCGKTDLPVLGVPVKSSILNGVDSLLSIVQMPAGIAVGTLAIGPAGATNAAIMAAQILGLTRPEIAKNVADFRAAQTDKVASNNIPGQV